MSLGSSLHPLAHRLAQVRHRFRRVALVRGLSRLVSAVLLILLAGGLLDYWLHLPGVIRALLLAGLLSAAGVIIYRHLVQPLSERVDDLSLALKVEEFYPDLNDCLASTVEFLKQPAEEEGALPLRQAAIQQALHHTESCDFTQIVDRRGTRAASLGMVALSILAITVIVWQPEAAATALARLAEPFGAREWPPQTRLVLDSFRTRIGRGEPFDIRASLYGVVPEQAIVRFWFDGGSPTEQVVTVKYSGPENNYAVRRSLAPHEKREEMGLLLAQLEPYRVQKSFRFQVQANDALTPWIAVRVLPPPALVPLDGKPSPQFRLRYPSYTDLARHDLPPGTSNIEAVQGTSIIMRAATDRRLRAAWIEYHPKHGKLVGLLAARNGLQAAALACAGEGIWTDIPMEMRSAFHGQIPELHCEFVPRLCGTYALRLVDESGLVGTRLFVVQLFADPAPQVTLERPSASFDTLAVLPDAVVTVQVRAEDPQYALRSVWLEHRCGRDEPAEKRLLYHQRTLGEALPPLLSAFAGRLPVPFKPLRLRPQRLLMAQRLPLAELKHPDGRALREGDIVILQACADDFDDWTPGKPPGKSQEVELHVVSRPALEALLHRAQEQVQQELQKLRQQQREALKRVEEVEKQWRATGRLRALDLDNLLEAEQVQQQVAGRVGNEQEGLRAEVARIQQALKDNNLPRSGTHERMAMVGRELDRLAREDLPHIEPQLTLARKENEQAQGRPPPPERRNRGALAQAKEHQEEVERTLTDLLASLDPFSSSRQARAEARALLQEQRGLAEQTQKLAESIPPGKKPAADNPAEQLTPQEKARLEEIAKAQERLAEHTRELLNRLQSLAAKKQEQAEEKARLAEEKARLAKEKDQQGEKERPNNAARAQELVEEARALRREVERLEDDAKLLEAEAAQLAKAAQVGRAEKSVDGQMQEAAKSIGQNQLNKAGNQQQQSAKTLEEMAKALENRREEELDQLVKKMRQAEQELARLVEEQDRLQKKIKEAEKITDPGKRAAELERLAREQERLRQEARDLAQQLSRMQAGRASQSLRQAGNQMDQAGQALERGENALDQQDEALDRLEEAQQDLQEAREKAQEELAREKLQKIAELLKQLKERQEAQLAETERIHRDLLQKKGWDRGLLASLQTQAKSQWDGDNVSLARDTVKLVEDKLKDAPVFAHILRKSALAMEKASQSMKDRFEEARDRVKLDGPAEEAAYQKTRKLQQEALALLDQLLDVLKPGEAGRRPGGGGQGQGGGGSQPESDGIPPLAQLKLLKALQQDVYKRTEEFARKHPDSAKLTDAQKKELAEIRKEQAVISDLLDQVTAPDPQGDKP